jgi:hypothetical protein
MMLDWAFSFLLQLVIVILLWWVARRSANARMLWTLLAAGWTLNFLGNLAWGVHDVFANEALSVFTWIDGLYLARYALLFLAFLHYPTQVTNRRWVDLTAVVSAATAVVWLWPSRLALAYVEDTHLYILGGMLYPILDAALTYVALLAWVRVTNRSKNALGILSLAIAAYGVANWINFGVRVVSLETSPSLAALFWPLSDILTGVAALYALRQETSLPSTEARPTSQVWIFDKTPYLASILTVGLTVYDLVRSGEVDPVLIACAVATLGTAGFRRWGGQGGDAETAQRADLL